ncbi:protein of unknown function [Flavobacterium flevense]|uniref:DUF4837 domain-containing protein n=1 Tax=Flavobacterium flevense TaxID=983 RepID=A0A4Y4AWJ2_9FLAO|nr:DUF4837 family protein [Flavobacterium flevense]GEC70793.1 DUF4837 domain-containing protein [Flavobacterium flevense]SHL53347.1 protein of unknown function [Flavobacterium flevense]
MNKIYFILFFVSIFFISCNQQNENTKETNGKINSISVIIDDLLWNAEIGDSIRNKFASPVIGLPQEEPLFTINQYPVKLMEGFMTDSRNIIVIKKDTKESFKIEKNKIAAPQNVFYISGKAADDILCLIQKNTTEIIKIIHQTEIEECQRINRKSLLSPKFFTDSFNINFEIPSSYQLMLRKENFMWFKKEIISGNTSILLYQVPISSIETKRDKVSQIIKMRDSIGKLYIHGKELNTDMITEEAYAPYFSNIVLNHTKAYETKGTWELKNDFMSGPFINYAIVDKENNRILVLEGFCYSPSKEKRDLMLELEAIIKSVEINKKPASEKSKIMAMFSK